MTQTIKELETVGEHGECTIIHGVRKDDVPILTGADGDYCPLTLNEFGILRTQAQQHKHIEECEATTGWTVLGNDAINLATTVNHVFGTYALEFDKVNGAANTKIGGIQKTLTSMNLTPYHVGSGYLLMSIYLSSLVDVDYIFLRLGTDASNYNEWRVDADVLTEGWNLCACIAGHPETVQGNGWADAAVTYVACGAAFDAETDALADIAIDRIAYNTGLVTTTPVIAPKNINLLKIKNKVVDIGVGNAGTGTQRISLANESKSFRQADGTGRRMLVDGSRHGLVREQNLDGDGLIQQSQHLKGYDYNGSAWEKAALDPTTKAQLMKVEWSDLNASVITAGDLAAARMSTNIIAAIAGLDPTFTTVTFDTKYALFRDTDDDLLTMCGASTRINGAYFDLRGGDNVSLPGSARIVIGDYRSGQTPNSVFEIRYNANEIGTNIFILDKSGNITTVARGDFSAGVRLGTAQDANHFDDGSHGASSTVMYIGNKTINTTFTGCHHYQLGDLDLQKGESVKLINHKIYRTTQKQDKAIIGIFWGITDYKDSLGNVYIKNEKSDESDKPNKSDKPIRISDNKPATKTDFAYSVAALGDSYEEHDKNPLTGAWVTIDAGAIEEGDVLCSSDKLGYLEKQSDDIRHNYTKGIAREKITEDTKTAYIELI